MSLGVAWGRGKGIVGVSAREGVELSRTVFGLAVALAGYFGAGLERAVLERDRAVEQSAVIVRLDW